MLPNLQDAKFWNDMTLCGPLEPFYIKQEEVKVRSIILFQSNILKNYAVYSGLHFLTNMRLKFKIGIRGKQTIINHKVMAVYVCGSRRPFNYHTTYLLPSLSYIFIFLSSLSSLSICRLSANFSI